MSRVNAASVPGHRPAVLAALQTPDRVLVDLRTGEGALWAEMGPDRRPADLPRSVGEPPESGDFTDASGSAT